MISFDSASNNVDFSGAGPMTWSHTCAVNDILFIAIGGPSDSTDHVTAVTYAGVAATLVGKILIPTDNSYIYLYFLQNPAVGSNTVSISYTGTFIRGTASSYAKAKQTGGINASATGSSGASGTFSLTVASTVNNCWSVMVAFNSVDATTPTAGAGTVKRTANSRLNIYDSGAVISPAGNSTLNANANGASLWGGVIATFAPSQKTFLGGIL